MYKSNLANNTGVWWGAAKSYKTIRDFVLRRSWISKWEETGL